MVIWSWILLAIVDPASAAPQPEFLSAWAQSDYHKACTLLDQDQQPLVDSNWRSTAVKARVLCGKDDLAGGRIKRAKHHNQACSALNIDEGRCQELSQLIDGWEALVAVRRGTLGPAVIKATQVASEHWPKDLPVELLRSGGHAIKEHRVAEAQATLSLLEARAPDTFGLSELRSSIWWATKGATVAFRIALVGFMLLLALTLRSLLRTRRRAKALLEAEI